MPPLKNIIGSRFGRLLVKSRLKGDHNPIKWNCVCDCGAKCIVNGNNLRRGHTKSCGCLLKDRIKDVCRKHGFSGCPEYGAWKNMVSRCFNIKHKHYRNYGMRGIIVCDKWVNSFLEFYKDMGPRPTPKHSIDRINNEGNYEPNNCRWADKSTQNHNKRKMKGATSIYIGVSYHRKNNKWLAWIKLNKKQFYLGTFNSEIDAANAYNKKAIELYGNNAILNEVNNV